MLCPSDNCLAQIKGNEKIDIGGKIDLKIEGEWDIIFWSVSDEVEFETFDSNARLLAWTGSKEQVLIFDANVVKLDWERQKVTDQQSFRHRITVGVPVPPIPPVPPDLTGLAKDVFNWSMAVSSVYRSKANQLSVNYSNVAKRYADMELTLEQALEEIRKGNNSILSTQQEKDAWAVFGSRLQGEMSNRWPMDRVTFVKFLNDVAKGLSYVK